MTDNQDSTARKWIDDAEEALNRAGEALRAAWDGTREARMSTLEAAKEATSRLGDAIDQGIKAAKQAWDPGDADSADSEEE